MNRAAQRSAPSFGPFYERLRFAQGCIFGLFLTGASRPGASLREPLRVAAQAAKCALCPRSQPMDARSEPAVRVDRLAKVYKTSVAVDGISFALERGSITGLLGGNGAGKTTTIAMLMGLVTPTSGTARVLGAEMPRERYRVLHRMNFESPYVEMPMRLTIRQNLTVFGMLYSVANLSARIAEIAAELDLTDLLERPTGKLSAGQK